MAKIQRSGETNINKYHQNRTLFQVSDIKIIDIYCLTCYLFVVLVMVEYAVVLLLEERVTKEEIFLKENKVL